jgi:cell division septal protein FtsQ
MSQVAAPADRRFRRAHVKPARKRRWRAFVRYAVAVGLVLMIAAFVAYRGTEVAMHARMLQIDRLVVTGNERVPSATVLAAVEGLKGQNLMWTDLEEWRGRLLQSPWVRDAALRRSLPSTVEIAVSERLPAIIARLDGRLFLVDDQGIVIDHFGPSYASFNLPIVDGLSASGPGPGVKADPTRASLAARVVAALRGNPDIAKRVSQIDVADPHNAHVTLAGDPAVLYLGDEQFQQRVESYLQLADRLRESVPDIEYVDLRFGSRVFVGPARAEREARESQADVERSRRSSAVVDGPAPTRTKTVASRPGAGGTRPRARRR